MNGLSQNDYRLALQAVADICSERRAERFAGVVVSRLAALVPSDVVSFNLAGPAGLLAVDEPAGTCTPALRAELLRLLGEHPMVSYAMRSGDSCAYRLSDFRSLRQFSNTALYSDFYEKIGLRHELSFTEIRSRRVAGDRAQSEKRRLPRSRPVAAAARRSAHHRGASAPRQTGCGAVARLQHDGSLNASRKRRLGRHAFRENERGDRCGPWNFWANGAKAPREHFPEDRRSPAYGRRAGLRPARRRASKRALGWFGPALVTRGRG